MAHIERSVEIDAPLEKVWAKLMDPSSYMEWFANLESVRDVETPAVGSKFSWTFKMAGLFRFDGQTTFTDITPMKGYQQDITGAVPGKWNFHLEPVGDKTRLTISIDYTLPGSVAGRAVDKMIVEPQNERDLEKSLANLKRVVEQALARA